MKFDGLPYIVSDPKLIDKTRREIIKLEVDTKKEIRSYTWNRKKEAAYSCLVIARSKLENKLHKGK